LSEEEVNSPKPSLFGMVLNPGDQFDRMRERPIIWVEMALITLMFMVGMWLQSISLETPVMEGLTAEEIAMIETVTTVTMIITAVFIPIFNVLISSAILMLVAKIARSEVTFKQLFSMNTYIMFIGAIGIVLNGILIVLFGGNTEMSYTTLGSLVDAEGAIAGLLSSLEVFTIWSTILTAIGLQKVANLSKGLSWTIAIVIFAIGVFFAMFGAWFNGMVGA